MPLPDDFLFSQSNLQDYAECARRFELRYLQRVQYPAVEAQPAIERERHMRQGEIFHRMVQQHLLGVPADALSTTLMDDDLARWWENYLQADFVATLPPNRHPEISLSAPIAGYRLIAKYDLIAIEPGARAIIVDWKTSTHKTKRAVLEKRLQTLAYPFVLAQAGAHLNGGQPLKPEQIEMVYWFPEYPDQPEHFAYSVEQFKIAGEQLSALIEEIKGRKVFDLTTDTTRCRFCTYRSLCDRGVEAGQIDEMDEEFDDAVDLDFDIDFDQVAEVEF
jgi:predicted RecB family nuclease